MSDHVITAVDFKDYADHFGNISDTGQQSFAPLENAISLMGQVDESYYDIQKSNSTVQEIKLAFRSALKKSYSSTRNQALNLNVMSKSYRALAKHIYKWTRQDINTYLNANNLTVNKPYAWVASVYGESIITNNIEGL